MFTTREVHPAGGVIEPDQKPVLVQTIVAIMRSPFTTPAGLAIASAVPNVEPMRWAMELSPLPNAC